MMGSIVVASLSAGYYQLCCKLPALSRMSLHARLQRAVLDERRRRARVAEQRGRRRPHGTTPSVCRPARLFPIWTLDGAALRTGNVTRGAPERANTLSLLSPFSLS